MVAPHAVRHLLGLVMVSNDIESGAQTGPLVAPAPAPAIAVVYEPEHAWRAPDSDPDNRIFFDVFGSRIPDAYATMEGTIYSRSRGQHYEVVPYPSGELFPWYPNVLDNYGYYSTVVANGSQAAAVVQVMNQGSAPSASPIADELRATWYGSNRANVSSRTELPVPTAPVAPAPWYSSPAPTSAAPAPTSAAPAPTSAAQSPTQPSGPAWSMDPLTSAPVESNSPASAGKWIAGAIALLAFLNQ